MSQKSDSQENAPAVHFDHIAFFGRRLKEYECFFNFSTSDYSNKQILDVAAGTSSFASEASIFGAKVTAIDPCYALDPTAAHTRAKEDFDMVMASIRGKQDYLVKTTFKSLEELAEMRWGATEKFLVDYKAQYQSGRYLAETLPKLSFEDNTFDLALCGHFLFLFSDRLDYAFHRDSLIELCRVARDVRLYPLVGTDTKEYPQLKELRSELLDQGIESRMIDVDYAVIQGSGTLLQLTHK
ncbi:hypothetical protein [Rubellicoccus peritrichatus]|uniref:SAM-dependent methyltransferase n=1 Tax=Rubellicoccus peritrichatus TaxID=3080537 RepID=A0AAQ3QU13_9BACT|nr:hypothetical protein [Puniceicoccus sp. CR14]WOO39510.1 hypothetical protein RZN69_12875 [Puniceicoccus sp. CR14]